MFKPKLNQFKLSIRKQKKAKIIAQMRKQQYQIDRIDCVIRKLFELKIQKQNFGMLKDLFIEINQCLTNFSKNHSKGQILNIAVMNINCSDLSINPLQRVSKKFSELTTQKFKSFLLEMIFFIRKEMKLFKHGNTWLQISEQLLSELTYLIGILFSQPESLMLLFPLESIQNFMRAGDQSQNNSKQSYDNSQKTFESSFELFENNIFYLEKYFLSISNLSDDKIITFLTIMHSLSITLDYLVLNSQQKICQTTIWGKSQLKNDDKVVAYFKILLKSNNFELFFGEMLNNQMAIAFCYSEDGYFEYQQIIFHSLILLIDKYSGLIDFLNTKFDTNSFGIKIKKFLVSVMNWYSFKKNSCNQLPKNANTYLRTDQNQVNNISNDLIQEKILFLHYSLTNRIVTALNSLELLPLCHESIYYLLKNVKIAYQRSENYLAYAKSQSRSVVADFYWKVLVAQQGQRWSHFLEILKYLQFMVTDYCINLHAISEYSLEMNFIINEKIVIDLFQGIGFCIKNISGHFQNQRYMFVQSLVRLFATWSDLNAQIKCKQQIVEDEQWGLEFWVKTSQILYSLLDDIELISNQNEGFLSLNQNKWQGENEREWENQDKGQQIWTQECQNGTFFDLMRNFLDQAVQSTKNMSSNFEGSVQKIAEFEI